MAVEEKNFSVEGVKKALHGNDSLESFDSQTLAKFCQELQIKTSGTKKELIKRLLPLKDEDLFDRRVKNTNFQQLFQGRIFHHLQPDGSATLCFSRKFKRKSSKNTNHRNGKE